MTDARHWAEHLSSAAVRRAARISPLVQSCRVRENRGLAVAVSPLVRSRMAALGAG